MLEIIGGISLTIFLIVLTSNLPILGFIITFIMAFFFLGFGYWLVSTL